MNFFKLTIISFILILLSACSAMLVPSTSDPKKKLSQAEELINNQLRAIPAQRLIVEALDIYKKDNNNLGIAAAYRGYAFFLASDALTKWEGSFRKNGFLLEDITFDNRNSKAIKYFKKSESIYIDANEYGRLTNLYYKMGNIFAYNLDNKKSACVFYDKSIAAREQDAKLNPNNIVDLPKGYNNWSEVILYLKSEIKCT